MGYIKHNVIVVTSWNDTKIQKAHQKATELLMATSQIVPSSINGYSTFIVVPDGSKEGWDESNVGDSSRERFRIWLMEQYYSDGSSPFEWFEAEYSSDDEDAKIVTHQWVKTIEPVSPLGSDCDAGAMMGDTPELKPCPFCGGDEVDRYEMTSGRWCFECQDCGAEIYVTDKVDWNSRAADGEIDTLKEEPEEIVNIVVVDGGITDSTPNGAGNQVPLEPSPSQMISERIGNLKRQIATLKAENERLRDEISDTLFCNESITKCLTDSEADLTAARAENKQCKKEIDGLKTLYLVGKPAAHLPLEEWKKIQDKYKTLQADLRAAQTENERLQKKADLREDERDAFNRARLKAEADLKEARERIAQVSKMLAEAHADACLFQNRGSYLDSSRIAQILAALENDASGTQS